MQRKKFKGVINTIAPSVLMIVFAVFIVAFSVTMLGSLRDTQTVDSAEYNVTVQGITGLSQFGNWWSILVLAIIFGVIIGVIGMYFGGFLGGGRRRF